MSNQDSPDPPRTFEHVEPRDVKPQDEPFGEGLVFRLAARIVGTVLLFGLIFAIGALFNVNHRAAVNIGASIVFGIAILCWLVAHFLSDRKPPRQG